MRIDWGLIRFLTITLSLVALAVWILPFPPLQVMVGVWFLVVMGHVGFVIWREWV